MIVPAKARNRLVAVSQIRTHAARPSGPKWRRFSQRIAITAEHRFEIIHAKEQHIWLAPHRPPGTRAHYHAPERDSSKTGLPPPLVNGRQAGDIEHINFHLLACGPSLNDPILRSLEPGPASPIAPTLRRPAAAEFFERRLGHATRGPNIQRSSFVSPGSGPQIPTVRTLGRQPGFRCSNHRGRSISNRLHGPRQGPPRLDEYTKTIS